MNYENDSALGLSCTETTRNTAANKLYGKSFKDLSEEQKQLTLLQMVEDANKLSGALGQASRESDTWANQLGNLKDAWTQFKGKIGDKALAPLVEILKKISGGINSIDTDKLANTIGNAFQKIADWVNSIDWKRVGENIGEIWGYLKEFLGGAWESLKSALEPIVDLIIGIWNAISGDVETENIDSVNTALEGVKPTFEWLAEHGEEVGDGIIAITTALATFKISSGAMKAIEWLGKVGGLSGIWQMIKGGVVKAVGGATGGVFAGAAAFMGAYQYGKRNDWYKSEEEGGKGFSSTRVASINEGRGKEKSDNWEQTKKRIEEIGEAISNFFDKINNWFDKFEGDPIGYVFSKTGEKLEEIGKSISDWFGDLIEDLSKWWEEDICDSEFVNTVETFLGDLKESWETWGEDIAENWEDVKKEWSDFWDGIANSKFAKGLGSFFDSIIGVLNGAIQKFLTGCNYIIKGINFVYRKITGKEEGLIGEINVKKWQIGGKTKKLAKGTNNWQGGTAIVGEAGRELVSDPRLGTFMADRPMLLPLSKGASVLKNSKTERLMRKLGVGMFAKGTNEGFFDTIGEIWSFLTNPKGLWDKILGVIDFGFGDNPLLKDFGSGLKRIFSGEFIINWIKGLFEKFTPSTGGSADSWIPQIIEAGAFFGETLSSNDIKRIVQQIQNESGGRANAVQSPFLKDINVLNGNPARGLLQYIPSTFNAYKVKGYENIYNGFHQLLAFFNNSQWRKNLPELGERRGWTPRGARRMANGGLVNTSTYAHIGESGSEAIVPLSNTHALKPFGNSVANALLSKTNTTQVEDVNVTYEFTIPVTIDGKEVAKATATFTKEELAKLEKRDGRRNGRK